MWNACTFVCIFVYIYLSLYCTLNMLMYICVYIYMYKIEYTYISYIQTWNGTKMYINIYENDTDHVFFNKTKYDSTIKKKKVHVVIVLRMEISKSMQSPFFSFSNSCMTSFCSRMRCTFSSILLRVFMTQWAHSTYPLWSFSHVNKCDRRQFMYVHMWRIPCGLCLLITLILWHYWIILFFKQKRICTLHTIMYMNLKYMNYYIWEMFFFKNKDFFFFWILK